jgi:reverse transcriptase-like protein
VSLKTPEKLRTLQEALGAKAKREPSYRFYLLYDKVYRDDVLLHAWALSRSKNGAPGVDRKTFADIEAYGVEKWLAELKEELRRELYKPQPVRRVMIPKASGVGERPLGIPTIRDRVVQTAAKLVLEPIFEVDFDDAAYGYRPGRSAVEAVTKVHTAVQTGHTEVVDADVSKYFDTIPACRADEVSRTTCQRREDAASGEDVAQSPRRGARRARRSSADRRQEDEPGDAAGGSDFAATGEHLHPSLHQGVSHAQARRVGVWRRAGELRGRFRGPLPAGSWRGARHHSTVVHPHRA